MGRHWTEDKRASFAQHLTEALPYMQRFRGKTMVIKYGGAAMTASELRDHFTSDLVLLSCVGIRPVVVHGGGPMISEMMKRLGKKPEFVDGHRVTDADTVEITEMVLCGTVNGQIVDAINARGGRAVGISGKDGNLLLARKRAAKSGTTEDVIDLGYVGEVEVVQPEIIRTLEEAGFIPVVSPLATSPDDRHTYNINADTVAGALAKALRAEKLILLSDTDGILRDKNDPASIMTEVNVRDVDRLIQEGIIGGGMIPKVQACVNAVLSGVSKAHIINGKIPHSLLLEIFTDAGIGTQIRPRV